MLTFIRFLGLVILLNLLRYLVCVPIEMRLVLPRLIRQMEAHSSYFNTNFTSVDWITSYFYNFMMWLTILWLFHLLRPVLKGHEVVKSLKVFGIGFVFFASLSAIYMNHYSHPKLFYLFNILDALIVFPIVAVANGLLYPLFMRKRASSVSKAA